MSSGLATKCFEVVPQNAERMESKTGAAPATQEPQTHEQRREFLAAMQQLQQLYDTLITERAAASEGKHATRSGVVRQERRGTRRSLEFMEFPEIRARSPDFATGSESWEFSTPGFRGRPLICPTEPLEHKFGPSTFQFQKADRNE
jgi:hypothetical protein